MIPEFSTSASAEASAEASADASVNSGAQAVIYGATGYTGRLIAAAASDAGLCPILVARDARQVRLLSQTLGFEHRVVSLEQPEALDAVLQDASVVINTAGPFSSTVRPVVNACLRTGTHYIDVTGEIPVFEDLHALDKIAQERGVMLMPGVGFSVTASDCLALHTARRLPDANILRIGISRSTLVSRGSAKTLLELFDTQVRVRRNQRLVKIPVASLEHKFDFGSGPCSALAVSWPDVFTAFHTTSIPNIETYFEVGALERATALYGRYSGWMLKLPMTQDLLKMQASWLPDGPSQLQRETHTRVIVVEAQNQAGRKVCSRVITPESYSFTALSGISIMQRILAGEFKVGFQTPAGVFGSELLTSLSGVQLHDLG